MAKKEEFQFKEYITNLDLNKYVKEGFIRSLEKEPKTLKETEIREVYFWHISLLTLLGGSLNFV